MAEWAKLTPARVQKAARDALPSLLLAAPYPDQVPSVVARPVEAWSQQRFSGSIVRPAKDHPMRGEAKLFVAREGLTLAFNEEERISVPTEECAAVARYDDGSVVAFGEDGFSLHLMQEDWDDLQPVTKWVDRLPEGTAFPAGPREARPQPVGPQPVTHAARRRLPRPREAYAGSGVMLAIAALIALIRITGMTDPAETPSARDFAIGSPDRLAPGQCLLFLPTTSSTRFTVGCNEMHEAEVLPASFEASGSSVVDTTRCNSLWVSGRPHYYEYRVRPYVDSDPGASPVLLCLLVPAGGGSVMGSINDR
jgi:hypothetical protein